MAQYGVDLRSGNPRSGFIAFSGWTPSLGTGQPQLGGGSGSGVVQFNGQTQSDNKIAQAFRKNSPALKFIKLLFSQVAGNPAGTATGATVYKQIKGSTGDLYVSLRPITDIGAISRNTTNGDMNSLRGMLNRTTFPNVYAKDVGGNGGGGKVKF